MPVLDELAAGMLALVLARLELGEGAGVVGVVQGEAAVNQPLAGAHPHTRVRVTLGPEASDRHKNNTIIEN